jgi:hypothetical protein
LWFDPRCGPVYKAIIFPQDHGLGSQSFATAKEKLPLSMMSQNLAFQYALLDRRLADAASVRKCPGSALVVGPGVLSW